MGYPHPPSLTGIFFLGNLLKPGIPLEDKIVGVLRLPSADSPNNQGFHSWIFHVGDRFYSSIVIDLYYP